MSGTTTHPEPEEQARLSIVEERKAELPEEGPQAKNDHHPVGKATDRTEPEPTIGALGKPEHTGAGKGTESRGH